MGKPSGPAAIHLCRAFFLMLLLAGCGGGQDWTANQPAEQWPVHNYEGAARSGAYAAVAVDSSERRIDPLTRELHLDVREEGGETLVRVIGRRLDPRRELYLHLRYDSEQLHPTLTRPGQWMPGDAIFLGITNQPGLVVFGLAGVRGRTLTSGDEVELAAVRFAPGGWQSGRGVSAVSDTPVTDLRFNAIVSGELLWSYKCTGDYDQNSEVNAADLVPISQHLKKTPASSDWQAAQVADGDGNTEVNSADLVPIAQNYRDTVTGYQIKVGSSEAGPFSNDLLVQFAPDDAPIPVGGGYRQLSATLAAPVDGSWYALAAVSAGPESSSLSNRVQFGSAGVLAAPQNLAAADGGLAVHLTWQAPTGGTPDGYNCYVATGAGMTGAQKMNTGNGDVTNLAFDCPLAVDPAGSYYFAAKAVYGGTESAYSNIFAYNIQGAGAPANLQAAVNGSVIRLTWDAASGTPDGYNTYVGTDAAMAGAIRMNLAPWPGSPFDCPLSVDPAQEHYFGVKTVTGGSESAFSNIAHFVPGGPADTTPPVWQGTGGVKAATPQENGGVIDVSWFTASDAQTNPVQYLLYVVPDGTPIDWNDPAEIFASTIVNTPVTTLPNGSPLQNGQRYLFAVRAQDSAVPPNLTTNVNFLTAVPQILPPSPTYVPDLANPLLASDVATVRVSGEEVPRIFAVNHGSDLHYAYWDTSLNPPDWTLYDLNSTIGITGRKFHPQAVALDDEIHLLFATSTAVYEAYGPKDTPATWQTKTVQTGMSSNPGVTGSALAYTPGGDYLACIFSGSQAGEHVWYSERTPAGEWSSPSIAMDGNPEVWQCDLCIRESDGAQWIVAANGSADANGDNLKFYAASRADRLATWTSGPSGYSGDVQCVEIDPATDQPVVINAEVRDVEVFPGYSIPITDAVAYAWSGTTWQRQLIDPGYADFDGASVLTYAFSGQDPQAAFSPTGKTLGVWSYIDFYVDISGFPDQEWTITGESRRALRGPINWGSPVTELSRICSSNSACAGESLFHVATCALQTPWDGTGDFPAEFTTRNDYAEGDLYYYWQAWPAS